MSSPRSAVAKCTGSNPPPVAQAPGHAQFGDVAGSGGQDVSAQGGVVGVGTDQRGDVAVAGGGERGFLHTAGR